MEPKVDRRMTRTARMVLLLVLLASSAPWAQQAGDRSARIDRLVALCKLWGAVKYFHPYLAYRSDIDWDKALVDTIPKVESAKTPADYGTAVDGLLQALGDPVSHVVRKVGTGAPTSGAKDRSPDPSFRFTADQILLVSMRSEENTSELQ